LPIPSSAAVAIGISAGIAPPPLPIYEQPRIPAPGYIWTPGYWAWSADGYYWVPGTWVFPPAIGLLWTPPWWGWNDGVYIWHAGYWGPHIGFYGGINYGFGYFGVGYAGGYWDRGQFFYNRTVNNITNVNITNVYNRTVVNNVTVNRVSFNGGAGGIMVRPNSQEQAAMRESHVRPTRCRSSTSIPPAPILICSPPRITVSQRLPQQALRAVSTMRAMWQKTPDSRMLPGCAARRKKDRPGAGGRHKA
jgi:YXWGXW repeat-containing protein